MEPCYVVQMNITPPKAIIPHSREKKCIQRASALVDSLSKPHPWHNTLLLAIIFLWAKFF